MLSSLKMFGRIGGGIGNFDTKFAKKIIKFSRKISIFGRKLAKSQKYVVIKALIPSAMV
jgi:hypothetical protein